MTGTSEASDDASPRWSELLADGIPAKLAVLCLGVWLHAADSMLVATLMPSAVTDIGGVRYIAWTIVLYQVGSIIAGAAGGLAARRLGLRTAMTGAAAIYAIGCVLSALTPDMLWMLIGRTLQGLGGGALVALAIVGVSQLFPERLWTRMIAVISGVWGASALCGPLVGGVFASIGLWRGGFWAFALQAVVLGLAVTWLLRRSQPHKAADEIAGVPFGRLAVLATAILSVAVAGIGLSLPLAATAVVVGLALLALFLRLDRAADNRLLPRAVLEPGTTVGAGLLMVFMLAAGTIAMTAYGALLMSVLHDADPLTAGYMIAVGSVSWTIAAIVGSGARPGLEPALIRLGAGLIAVGVAGQAICMPQGVLMLIVPWQVASGAGFGLAWAFVTRRVVAGAPAEEREIASSAMPTTQLTGYAVGAGLSGLVANAIGFADGVTPAAAEAVAFWIFAGFLPLVLIGNIAAWRLTRGEMQPQPAAA